MTLKELFDRHSQFNDLNINERVMTLDNFKQAIVEREFEMVCSLCSYLAFSQVCRRLRINTHEYDLNKFGCNQWESKQKNEG